MTLRFTLTDADEIRGVRAEMEKKKKKKTFHMHLPHNYQVKEIFAHLHDADAFEPFAS